NSTVMKVPTSSSESAKTSSDERTPLLIKNDSRDYIDIINDHSNIDSKRSLPKKQISKGITIFLRDLIDRINKIMNPPLGAALLGLFVGMIPPLKSLFFSHDSSFYLTITRTIEYLGSIAVPLTLIALGAQLKSLPHGKGQQML